MHTESDIFSSPKSQKAFVTQSLTKRLYPDSVKADDPYLNKAPNAFEELKRLVAMQPDLPSQPDENNELERRIKAFQELQSDRTKRYLELPRTLKDHCLYYLNGWPKDALYLTEQSRRSVGGIFLRWNGKGVVLNPDRHFLTHFHAEGGHIRDIDYVVVTGDKYADVPEIYALNYEINRASEELKIIHYYFNQKAFQSLSRILKPHFKQERNTLHSLELFVDSSDMEKIELGEGIVLHYFEGLGICLDLKGETHMRIGYISSPFHPMLPHYLAPCDLLITGFGNTAPQDYQRLSYLPDCLGYHGTMTLVEEVAPHLALCGEFGGREGDIRLEAIQKMRGESRRMILPADSGLTVNLKTLEVRCSVSGHWTSASELKVVKTAPIFGTLSYLSPMYVY